MFQPVALVVSCSTSPLTAITKWSLGGRAKFYRDESSKNAPFSRREQQAGQCQPRTLRSPTREDGVAAVNNQAKVSPELPVLAIPSSAPCRKELSGGAIFVAHGCATT